MQETTPPPRLKVILAYAAIYLVWGSTYFFIRVALDGSTPQAHNGFPPFMLGGLRFVVAALLIFTWCLATGQPIKPGRDLRNAAITGFLLCFVGNGAVVWVEQVIPSSVVAIMIAVAPLSFVVLDKRNWGVNFRSWNTLVGVVAGFSGVVLLFSEKIAAQFGAAEMTPEITALPILLLGIIGWPVGSLYAKYHPSSIPNVVNTGWQMLCGGLFFLLVSTIRGEWNIVTWSAIPLSSWFSLSYLIVFGSLIAFSAYVWLLQMRPATQVSTYAYVNPLVAVLLGVFIGNEPIGWREIAGLVVILGGVLLINLAKYRKRD